MKKQLHKQYLKLSYHSYHNITTLHTFEKISINSFKKSRLGQELRTDNHSSVKFCEFYYLQNITITTIP